MCLVLEEKYPTTDLGGEAQAMDGGRGRTQHELQERRALRPGCDSAEAGLG